ncbi:MAG: hypothetical protein AB7O32_05320 [Vicinamibacterales bacterium]
MTVMRTARGCAARARGARGFAVLSVVAAGLLVSALAAGWLLAAATDTGVASAFARGLESRQAARGALHWAAAELAGVPDWNLVLAGSLASSVADGPPSGTRHLPGGDPISLDEVRSLVECSRLSPCTDAERTISTRERPWGANNPRWQLYVWGRFDRLLPAGSAPAPFYIVVLVADDPAESDGDPLRDATGLTPGAGVLRLRSEAFGPAGAHHVVEGTVARPATPPGPSLRLMTMGDVL